MISCSTPEERQLENHQRANLIPYYKDLRTNLCFIDNVIWTSDQALQHDSHILAYVPCTPEVEKLVLIK